VTLNSMEQKRWQIVSDDHVWMYPADVTISTVELNRELYKLSPYETCIFFAHGDSDVVERYDSQEEAEAGHVKYEQMYKAKRISNV
jgi:hypothetical protein